jgi:sulfoxide reductase heme-binding subunit YedZ
MGETGSSSRRIVRVLLFLACCLPALLILTDGLRGQLGADPIALVMNRLGFWTLTFLLLSLTPTPLKDLFGWTAPQRYRRMIGLFTFFYALLHFSTYLGVDQFFDFAAIGEDIAKRPFITIGFLAFLLLVPMAVTSTDRWVRRLGFRWWKRLHRLSYVAAVFGVIHFVWRVKADLQQPLLFATALTVLLAARLIRFGLRKMQPAALSGPAVP